MKVRSSVIVTCYLGAIVGANLAVSAWGPRVVPVCSFLLIGFDLVAKDVMQERWQGWRRLLGLGGMIGAGSILSFLLAGDPHVALASCLSFGGASTADALVLAACSRWSHGARVNASNLAGAIVDSALFSVLAFGGVLPLIFALQVAAKVGGGALWFLGLRKLGVFSSLGR